MGSHMNFKNFSDVPFGDGCDGKPTGNNCSLARQSSIYSLTFDELQNTLGGSLGKDFGSMNMDELLKSICTAEETQILASTAGMVGGGGGGGGGGVNPSGNLHRQGSITLPRTLSQKTVDEVWRDLLKENDNGAKVAGNGTAGEANLPQRQQTLGEVTLEEFLVRAGIVREDAQVQPGRPAIHSGNNNNPNVFAFGFQQPSRNNGILDNRMPEMTMTNSASSRPLNLPINTGGVMRSSQQQQIQQQNPQQQQQQQQQQQPLYPKPATLAFAPPMHLVSNVQLTTPGSRETLVGITEPAVSSALVQGRGLPAGGGISRMANLCAGRVTLAAKPHTNHMSSDVVAKTSVGDSPTVSPVPYMFNREGKCSAALEKVIERRQRRMIKNRESAARSRARKQAYTLELEAEVAKLKEMNEELQRKQEEFMEMQKNQILETMNGQWGSKRQCLRRTLTGPW
ncbi:Basic-leucine zipper transcription factor [Parasponia andersonii]|uniref:Basic-leucine zipper transcription factor n=1 Tax=Parasponia andersonii TaxID=3476 RepID=A0A2P5D704_PARAD|nr:Basic-leucine zipper transcription factor [Parasponia andersonii]